MIFCDVKLKKANGKRQGQINRKDFSSEEGATQEENP